MGWAPIELFYNDGGWSLQTWFSAYRRTLTPWVVATEVVPAFACYYLTAILAQIPNTRLYRLALLPLTVLLLTNGILTWDVKPAPDGGSDPSNTMAIVTVLTMIMVNAMVFTFRPVSKRLNAPSKTPWNIFVNAFDLVFSLRGIGWDFIENPHLPPNPGAGLSRPMFVLYGLASNLYNLTMFDICVYITQSLGPDTFASPQGGSLYDPSRSPIFNYARASLVTALWVPVMMYGTLMCYVSLSVVAVGVFGQSPSQWPPLYHNPFLSTSLSEFWGKRWQQMFRIDFHYAVSYPLSLVFGRVGYVLGAFALSAWIHFSAVEAIGKGTYHEVNVTFMMMGIGVLLENLWKKITGRKPSGLWGRLWTASWCLFWTIPYMDALARVGYMGSEFLPHEIRPTTLLFGLFGR